MAGPIRWAARMVLAAALAPTPALADDQFWLTTGDDRLAQMRGGFAIGPGLLVSFGIARTVELNGAVIARTSFHVDDLRSMNASQAQQLAQAAAGTLVQNGAGNAFTVDVQNGLAAMVVQNALSNQQIRTVTQIDAVTNGMGLMKSLNLSRTLGDALAGALRH